MRVTTRHWTHSSIPYLRNPHILKHLLICTDLLENRVLVLQARLFSCFAGIDFRRHGAGWMGLQVLVVLPGMAGVMSDGTGIPQDPGIPGCSPGRKPGRLFPCIHTRPGVTAFDQPDVSCDIPVIRRIPAFQQGEGLTCLKRTAGIAFNGDIKRHVRYCF